MPPSIPGLVPATSLRHPASTTGSSSATPRTVFKFTPLCHGSSLTIIRFVSMTANPTAAILLIGNEILSGKVEDENARFLTRELRALGVALRRIEVVPDVTEEIADSVRILSPRFDHVFTSGGVGPTHDDVTLEAVGRAFGMPLVRHPDLETLLRSG